MRLFAKEQQQRAAGEGGGASFSDGKPLARAVYVAPLEALVTEKYVEWKEKLGNALGVKVAKLTGTVRGFKLWTNYKPWQFNTMTSHRFSAFLW